MTELSPEALEMQLQLQRRYSLSLPDKIAAIATAWRDVQENNFNATALARLKSLAHRLSGSAGSYGFDQLGLAALDLDRAIPDSPEPIQCREEMARRVDALLKNFHEAKKT